MVSEQCSIVQALTFIKRKRREVEIGNDLYYEVLLQIQDGLFGKNQKSIPNNSLQLKETIKDEDDIELLAPTSLEKEILPTIKNDEIDRIDWTNEDNIEVCVAQFIQNEKWAGSQIYKKSYDQHISKKKRSFLFVKEAEFLRTYPICISGCFVSKNQT